MKNNKTTYNKYLKAFLGIEPKTPLYLLAEAQWETQGILYKEFLEHIEAMNASTTQGTTMTTPKTNVKVTLTVNEYDVPMLAIDTKPRPSFISVKKAVAILATQHDSGLIETTEKYGRELFKVSYGNGKGFTIGQNKINAVLDNAELIEKAIA